MTISKWLRCNVPYINGWGGVSKWLSVRLQTKWSWVPISLLWIILLIKLKASTLAILINYIANFVTSLLLIIFWYYSLAPVANFWKQTHLERYVLIPLKQSLFQQMHNLLTDLCLLLSTWKFLLLQTGHNLET